jgi:hypothetical protein
MRYRAFGKTGLRVSALGFGAMRLPMDEAGPGPVLREDEAVATLRRAFELGVNYVDTGHGYCRGRSEPAVGRAVAGRREQVLVSTKSPLWLIRETGDWRRFLDDQLRIMDLEYLDIYYIHGLSWKSYEEKVRPLGLLREAERARDQGLIRHIGFSVHDRCENIVRLVDEGWAEVVLLQYNLLDQRNERAIAHARRRGLGVVVMGPVGGGSLGVESRKLRRLAPGGVRTTAELALRFVLANTNVSCALSGMGSVAMVEENAAVASRPSPLTPGELARLKEAIAETRGLADLYCTGCNYCMPCPAGVKIPQHFHLMNLKRVYGLGAYAEAAFRRMRPQGRAERCVDCGQCETKCPQHIPIRRQLREVIAVLGDGRAAAASTHKGRRRRARPKKRAARRAKATRRV